MSDARKKPEPELVDLYDEELGKQCVMTLRNGCTILFRQPNLEYYPVTFPPEAGPPTGQRISMSVYVYGTPEAAERGARAEALQRVFQTRRGDEQC